MEHLIWAKWGQLDQALDKTTWVEMTRALRSEGIRTTLVTSYTKAPSRFDGDLQVVWLPPRGGRGVKRLSFGLQALCAIERVQRRDAADYIIVDWASFYSALPTDLLVRAGLRRTSVTMDMRTFEFGFFGDEWTRHDRLLWANARLACRYNGLMHSGFTAIVPNLRDRALSMGASRRTAIWGSGFVQDGAESAHAPLGDEDRAILREIAAFVGERLAMVFHGVLAGNRGLELALRVMSLAQQETKELAFVLVGHGAMSEELQRQVSELKLTSCCRVFPAVSHAAIGPLLKMASIGCMLYPDIAYWKYNHPIKLVEYLSSGVPAIVTHTPVFLDNFAGIRGLVYAPDDNPESIAATLVDLVQHRERLERLSSEAAQDAQALSWACHGRTLAAFLRRGEARR